MERKNKDRNPIFYNSAEEMDKPLSELIEDLRKEIARIRGKLSDIRYSYGWEDRIDFIEGGLTCMLIAMHSTMQEMQQFEERNKHVPTENTTTY